MGGTRTRSIEVMVEQCVSGAAPGGDDGSPADPVVFDYRDPVAGFAGYLAIDGRHNSLAAGGFRVQPGLRAQTVARLARAMTLKQRLLGLGVDGAKCGIDFDPRDPGKSAAMRRFIRFLRPHLLTRFSMGPDMGTEWNEIECLARAEGIPSVKIAVAGAQGLPREEVVHRLRLLDRDVGGATLGQRRAGHGLAHAALAATGARDGAGLRVGVQGFGTLGRATVQSLAEAGARIVVVADEHGALVDAGGLDVARLLTLSPRAPVAAASPQRRADRGAVFDADVALLVLAACQDAMSAERAAALPHDVRAVVVGANLGLAPEVEDLLAGRGIAVVPDFVGGCGGSASMSALFGPPGCPTPDEFLDRLGASMRALVHRVLGRAAAAGVGPRAAALALCREPCSRQTPYGA
ncbi:MAG: Glu/Leu/Phe/Val dehydrogenase [Pseudonocardiaceae bacterium]|nr:Glu/Leu/Phe/Val dehydrogenase [Pseudonocardiaceae bacterium]